MRRSPVAAAISGLLTRLDRIALSRYRKLWARWRDAEALIATHGSVYTLKDGNGNARCAMPFPQVAIADRLSLALTKLEAQFEVTASGRGRIHVEMPPAVHQSWRSSSGPSPGRPDPTRSPDTSTPYAPHPPPRKG